MLEDYQPVIFGRPATMMVPLCKFTRTVAGDIFFWLLSQKQAACKTRAPIRGREKNQSGPYYTKPTTNPSA